MKRQLEVLLTYNLKYVSAEAGETLAVYNPHDESLVTNQVQVAGQADVDKAVAAARTAFHGEWATWSPVQRSAVMLKFADLVEKHVDELAPWEAKCMGQPVTITRMLYGLLTGSFRCKTTILIPSSQFY